jgi:hypothetical protein
VASGLVPGAQANETVTLELFQPLALGAGEIEAVMEGGVGATVWMFNVTLTGAVLPALSAAVAPKT